MQNNQLRKGANKLQMGGNNFVSKLTNKAAIKTAASKRALTSEKLSGREIQTVRISDILMADSPTTRIFYNISKVREYANFLEEKTVLPPVLLVENKTGELLVADGFYRIKAHMKLKRKFIQAIVIDGDAETAFLLSIEANRAHGVPFTREEKRMHIILLLSHRVWKKWSDRKIAELCQVSHKTVGNTRKKLPAQPEPEDWSFRLFERNGKIFQMDTEAINRKRSKTEEEEAPPDGEAISQKAIEINRNRMQPVKAGDRFLIKSKNASGYHIVMCGDSTDTNCLQELFGDDKADLYATDPPYNVVIQSNRTCPTKETEQHIANNEMGDKDFEEFLDKAFSAARKFLTDNAVYYIWAAFPFLTVKMSLLKKLLGIVRQPLIWNKKKFVRHPHYNYSWGHEMCLYGWLPEGEHSWNPETSYTTMFEGKICEDSVYDIKAKHHPCPKPVRIIEFFIENSLRPGKIVYDGFLGSGTTLIAAEIAGRLCYGVELLPEYLAVALDAFESEPLGLKVIPVPAEVKIHDFIKTLDPEDDFDMGLNP